MSLLAYILTFLLFVGPVIMWSLGWPLYGFVEKSEHLFLYPSFYVLSIFILFSFVNGELYEKKYKYALLICLVTFSWFIIDKVLGREGNMNVLFHSMALPAMYYIMYASLEEDQTIKNNTQKIILLMFFLNALFAIYERLTLNLYFPYDLIRSDFDYTLDDESVFRSSALLGHPLTNALIMVIVMAFILTSKFNVFLKYSLFFIGFFSLFCFNSRAAIMISVGLFALYSIRPLFQKDAPWPKRLFSIFLLFLFVSIAVYIFQSGYGGRFEEQGEFSEDGSTLARIEVWSILSEYGIDNFLWGMPYTEVEDLALAVLGMTHIENWFILSTMIVGLVITTFVVILFIPVYYSAVLPYDRFTSILIFIATIVLASSNNSFATGIPALSIFFACCFAFSPTDSADLESESQLSDFNDIAE